MGLQNAIQDARHTPQQITWTYKHKPGETAVPVNLLGATIRGTITDDANGVSRAVTGQTVLIDALSGIFAWNYSVADVGTVGDYVVQFTASYPDSTADTSFEYPWSVLAKR